MQFQIEKLILWPKNEKYEYKVIDFNIDTVNVITGDSRTGKSAIIPIIDYCLASGDCYIPTQTIRKACSWFGIVVKLKKGRVLFARKEPGLHKSTSEMMLIHDDIIEIPNTPEKNATCQSVKRFLDEYSKLSFIDTDEGYYGSRPAFRDLISFCFQPQNIVANANILFYKTDKTEHRNKLINIFPYVLGAITPEVLSARQELLDLQRQLKKKESDYEKLCQLATRWEDEIKGWMSVAIELGLIEESSRNISFDSQLKEVEELVRSNTEEKIIKSDSIINSSWEIVKLRESENSIALELTKYKNRYIEMSQLTKSINEYRDALTIQIERLNITSWLDERAKKGHICPVCQQKCDDDNHQRNLYFTRLKEAKNKKKQLEDVPAAFEREYDLVKGEIQRLTEELASIQKRIKIEESRKKQEAVEENINPNRYTLDGISRFLGKIEYASETIASLEVDGELSEEINKLKIRINELKKIVDESVIRRKIDSAITRVSVKQMELIKSLDSERPNDPFKLDYKNLTVEVDSEDGRKDYLWEIGSGSNWLEYHISTILGLQSFFSTFQASVPNFIVFDQPSQVYFPHLSDTDELEVKNLKDVDKEAVKSIFSTMAKCIANTKGKMQIIVLEHADSSIYGEVEEIHEVCVWQNGDKLIPLEWIQ
ncbi:DUF3732 domain-containing protein [Anaeromicropila herbilytica]|uniref:DUF3732 domain-containing protein n=1 Tax=Anaeromicropila herbilytica TaxID=2785025 RepID=A0A7R7IF09_9FIRM|nr:DUF3732 domain-containing protein [Anaeromicropila herbilytica]BCN32601.1 hypothetical protein bsdtb5_38960 [Anaeromicropila herbilytica]